MAKQGFIFQYQTLFTYEGILVFYMINIVPYVVFHFLFNLKVSSDVIPSTGIYLFFLYACSILNFLVVHI